MSCAALWALTLFEVLFSACKNCFKNIIYCLLHLSIIEIFTLLRCHFANNQKLEHFFCIYFCSTTYSCFLPVMRPIFPFRFAPTKPARWAPRLTPMRWTELREAPSSCRHATFKTHRYIQGTFCFLSFHLSFSSHLTVHACVMRVHVPFSPSEFQPWNSVQIVMLGNNLQKIQITKTFGRLSGGRGTLGKISHIYWLCWDT